MTVADGLNSPHCGVPGRIEFDAKPKDFVLGIRAYLTNKHRHEYMMKKTLLLVALVAMAVTGASAQMLVINEVYPGGGSAAAGTAYTRDFVEIYNLSATPFSLAGYSLQYASSAGAFTNTIVNFGTGSIIGGNDYISIYTGSTGTGGTALTAGTGAGFVTYVAPASSASISATSGAVRLYNTTTSTTIDVVGFGTLTNSTVADPKFEGTAASAPSSTALSISRTAFADTNVNSADFSGGTPSPNAGLASVVVPAVVPEPSTWAAMIGGLGLLSVVLRHRRRMA